MNAAVQRNNDGSSGDYREGLCAACRVDAAEHAAAEPIPQSVRDMMARLADGPKLRVKRVHQDAQLPRYATDGAACFDVAAVDLGFHTRMLPAGKADTFRTGLAFEVPEGYVMLVFSRSGHGFKNDVRLANCVGVIDSDYRGELRVRLTADAHGTGIGVRDGDRIAQCLLLPVLQWRMEEVTELSDTARGDGAYGSTGR